jgi:hypothetical protein
MSGFNYIVHGDGATCAWCGGLPRSRYEIFMGSTPTLAWACNPDHAVLFRNKLSGGKNA